MNKSLAATAPTILPPVEALVKDSASLWLVAVALGSAALAVSAQLSIPMVPVPMTMQTYVVLMIGVMCGWRLAALTVLAYLIEGAAGLPVFSDGHSGLAWLMGKTGGYLFGYLFAAAAMGYLADRGWNSVWWKLALSLSIGHVIVFALGVSWLAIYIGWSNAIVFGLIPFLLGTVLKTALAFFSVYGVRQATSRV